MPSRRFAPSGIFRRRKALICGVPDQKYGEEICAWIVLKPGNDCTEDDIREFCRNQIAHYKVPRYIRFVEEMPMTVTGKAQKFVMRERMIERNEDSLGLNTQNPGRFR